MAENQGEISNAQTQDGFDSWLEPERKGQEVTQTSPSNGSVPPVNTGQGADPSQGQDNELFKPSDFGAYDSWDAVKTAFDGEKEGGEEITLSENTDPKEMAKSYANLRSKMTQDAQKHAELERRFAQLEQRFQAPPSPAAQPQGITPEQLQELWLSDPAKAAVETLKANPDVLSEALGRIPGIDRLYKAADRVEANEIVGSLRERHSDFQNYEKDIMAEIAQLGDYAPYIGEVPDGVGVELVYRAVRAEKLLKNIFEKVGKGQVANLVTQKGNNGALNLGGNGILPPKPGQKVKIGNMGEFDAEDLGFVDPYSLSRFGR